MGLLYSHYEANPTTKINAVSGTLVKTFRKSFFKRFHMNSTMAKYIFDTHKPRLSYDDGEIIVLQTMLCGEGEFLAEIMYKEDYDELFNVEIESNLKESGE